MRPLVPLSALIALGALVVLALAGVWADGDAVDHAREHALYAFLAAVAAVVIGSRWDAELPSLSSLARLGLVAPAALLAAAQLLAAGAVAGEGRESAGDLHDAGYWVSLAALAALGLGALLTLAYAGSRLRTWRRHPAARF